MIGIPTEQRHPERNWPVPRESGEAAASCLQYLRLEKSLTGGLQFCPKRVLPLFQLRDCTSEGMSAIRDQGACPGRGCWPGHTAAGGDGTCCVPSPDPKRQALSLAECPGQWYWSIPELCHCWRAGCDPWPRHAQHLFLLPSPSRVVVTLPQNLKLP